MSIHEIGAHKDWMDDGLCQAIGGFVLELADGPDARIDRLEYTARQKVCKTCPVWEQCAEFTLAIGPTNYGVWAGHMLQSDCKRNQAKLETLAQELEDYRNAA